MVVSILAPGRTAASQPASIYFTAGSEPGSLGGRKLGWSKDKRATDLDLDEGSSDSTVIRIFGV